jgi:hypothetical protein
LIRFLRQRGPDGPVRLSRKIHKSIYKILVLLFAREIRDLSMELHPDVGMFHGIGTKARNAFFLPGGVW